jgi:hypothetical protein
LLTNTSLVLPPELYRPAAEPIRNGFARDVAELLWNGPPLYLAA